jgi:isopropylmalate/homocitrate/citramalate synthase
MDLGARTGSSVSRNPAPKSYLGSGCNLNHGERMIEIVDVGPRDGLQNEAQILSPSLRIELTNKLVAAGLKRIEAVSFVNPARVPQMAGAEEVIAGLEPRTGVFYAGLVLNEKGFDRAIAAGVRDIRYAFPVTESFCQRNQNSSVQAATELAAILTRKAREENVNFGVILATVFGCPFEGRVSVAQVLKVAEKVLETPPDELILADTIGVGNLIRVRELFKSLEPHVTNRPTLNLGAHFHNTRNTGYANAIAAIESGARVLDSSIGGLGGCPFAPNATGNIATEDLVYLLEEMGFQTGINLEALIEVSNWLEAVMHRKLPGMVYKAGGFPNPRA